MKVVCFIEGRRKEVEMEKEEFEKVKELFDFVNEYSADVVIRVV